MRARLPSMLSAFLLALPILVEAEPLKPASPPALPSEDVEVEVNDPKLKADIEDALQRGVAWLKARQLPTGAWPGFVPSPVYASSATSANGQPELSALALLALLKCGVAPTDPCIVKGLAYIQKQDFISTGGYGPAIALMVIEAKYASKEAIAGKKGQKAAKPKPITPSPEDFTWATKMTNQLIGCQSKIGGWRYAVPPADMAEGKLGYADVSNTQYALMGLKTARRLGIPVKAEAFARAVDFLLDQQEADGKAWTRITRRKEKEEKVQDSTASGYADKARGFPYMKGAAAAFEASASGSMTCAGLVGLLICRSEMLDDPKFPERAKRLPKVEQAIWDALAWLDAHWNVTENPSRYDREYEVGYYLYALERVGVMADLRMLGPGHDWYMEGAGTWIARLNKDPEAIAKTLGGKPDPKALAGMGFWAFSNCLEKAETQDTPYALLFLRKASIKLGYSVEDATPAPKKQSP